MFLESEVTWTVTVNPSEFRSGLHIRRALLKKLLEDFNKVKCSEEHGYYLCATTLEGIGEGKLWDGKGCVAYKVRFRCLTFKPVKYEPLLVEVAEEPGERGVFCCFGPLDKMFLSSKHLEGYTFVAKTGDTLAHYMNKDGSKIEMGCVLRARILSVKYNILQRGFACILSINGKYLGVEKRITGVLADENGMDGFVPMEVGEAAWASGTQAKSGGNDDGGWGKLAPAGDVGSDDWDADTFKSNGKGANNERVSSVAKTGKGGNGGDWTGAEDWDAAPAHEDSAGGWDSDNGKSNSKSSKGAGNNGDAQTGNAEKGGDWTVESLDDGGIEDQATTTNWGVSAWGD